MAAIHETNPQILHVLKTMQAHMQQAVASGDFGHVICQPLPYFPGKLGKFESARTISVDLVKLAAKP